MLQPCAYDVSCRDCITSPGLIGQGQQRPPKVDYMLSIVALLAEGVERAASATKAMEGKLCTMGAYVRRKIFRPLPWHLVFVLCVACAGDIVDAALLGNATAHCQELIRSLSHADRKPKRVASNDWQPVQETIDDHGLLQPLGGVAEHLHAVHSSDMAHRTTRRSFSVLVVARFPMAEGGQPHDGVPELIIDVSAEGRNGGIHWIWPPVRECPVALEEDGQLFINGLGGAESRVQKLGSTEHVNIGLSLNCGLRSGLRFMASVNGESIVDMTSSRLLALSNAARALKLTVGTATYPGELDFEGHVFEVAVWDRLALSAVQLGGSWAPPPSSHIHRHGSCDLVQSGWWADLYNAVSGVSGCLRDPGCFLPRPAYVLLSQRADVIAYADVSDYNARSKECQLGFVLALAIVCMWAQFEASADPLAVDGMLKVAISHVPPMALGPAPTFGRARPFALMRDLQHIARRRLLGMVGMPAWANPSHLSAARRTNNSTLESTSPSHSDLVVHVWHKTVWPLQRLRNCIESLATAGVFQSQVVKRKERRGAVLILQMDDCRNKWTDRSSPEGWYVAWLGLRFGATFICDTDGLWQAPANVAVLRLTSHWHLLPLRPDFVAHRLTKALHILRNNTPIVTKVSMSEKSLHALGGVRGRGLHMVGSTVRTQPTRDDIHSLAMVAPILTGGWDIAEAAQIAERISWLHIDALGGKTWLSGSASEIKALYSPCASDVDALCGPSTIADTLDDDVWLSLGGDGHVAASDVVGDAGSRVALDHGLFHHSSGELFDATPHAEKTLGIPDCFACDLVPAQETKEFSLYLAPLDVVGPCRELFSNLLLDALEAIQTASFQGPNAILVEPLIANAVWRKYSKQDADALVASGRRTSIYTYWTAETSCGLRHGSAQRFGELFDWPALVHKLSAARGLRGGVSWQEFLARTERYLDLVAMQSTLPDGAGDVVPCEDTDGSSAETMRFFNEDLTAQRRVCIRSTSDKHAGGFELRFMDFQRLAGAIRDAVAHARSQGRTWAAVGLYFYWVEGAERARLHPGRYGVLGTHSSHASVWHAMRFAPNILRRAGVIKSRLGLDGQRYLAAHWRRGDWFLGPHPRKLEQAVLADPERFAQILRKHLQDQNLQRVFLMTNAAPGSADIVALVHALGDAARVVQAPVMSGDKSALQQLCVEMAVATDANFFVAFGDGLVAGMASMPSLLVLQMRLHERGWPIEANAFAFAQPWQDRLGL